MSSIGLFCPPTPGHLNPMTLLGRRLRERGHQATLFGVADAGGKARASGLDFRVLGASEYPPGSVEESVRVLGKLSGLQALRYTIDGGRRLAETVCRYAPEQVRAAGVDLMIVDQNEPAGGSVAEYLRIPYVNLVNLPLNFDADVPPPFSAWPYEPGMASRVRNRSAYRVFYWILGPVTKSINEFRTSWGLPPLKTPDDSFSPIAQICQMTKDLDFPRTHLPLNFHYAGLFFDEDLAAAQGVFPFEQLNGKRMIYACMGTLQNRDFDVYRRIAEACAGLEAQLVLSLGGGGCATDLTGLAGDPIVVDYAPQYEMLQRASVVITHGGLNTVQEALRYGLPMVAIPVTNDQPAVAARLKRCGAAEVVPVAKLTAQRLHEAVLKVLGEVSYRAAAERLRTSQLSAGGLERAAELVEAALSRREPGKALASHA